MIWASAKPMDENVVLQKDGSVTYGDLDGDCLHVDFEGPEFQLVAQDHYNSVVLKLSEGQVRDLKHRIARFLGE
jgi:hypothetical protein